MENSLKIEAMEPPVRTTSVLSPQKDLFESIPWHSSLPIQMGKGAAMGFSARCISNMLINKPALWSLFLVIIGPGYHMIWAAIGSIGGYYLLDYKKRQLERVEKLRDKLVMRRMQRQKALE